MSYFKIVFGVIYCINLGDSFFHNYGSLLDLNSNELRETVDGTFIYRKWIKQPLDHFDPKDNRTWKMKYYERTSFWKEGKPIFLIMGWNGEIDKTPLMAGTVVELGKETNGALFVGEHRYYGQSQPFDRLTTKNLKFLISRQALADFANLLKYIKSSPKFGASKVVVVGIGYSGSLAVWMRLLYPDLVDAAYASSAPVLAKLDFFEFAEKISDNFKQYGSPGCWNRIAEKSAHYEKGFQTEEGIKALKKELNICDGCDMNNRLNQQCLFLNYWLAGFGHISLSADNISEFKEFCDSNFTSKLSKTNDLGRSWISNETCICYDFKETMEAVKFFDFAFAWFYQVCTEFSDALTTSSNNQPFTKFMTIDYFSKTCEYLYGPDFNETRMAKGVEETNYRYGGLKPNITKVVFVNGDLDPWSRLSILEDLSPDTPAIRISQTSACKDWRPEEEGDSEELKEARARIKTLIKSWIGEAEYYRKP